MNDIAIKVENLSKRYRMGLREERHDTLAGLLTDFVTRPARNLRRLRSLSTFDDGHRRSAVGGPRSGEAPDIIWALKDVSFEACRSDKPGDEGG